MDNAIRVYVDETATEQEEGDKGNEGKLAFAILEEEWTEENEHYQQAWVDKRMEYPGRSWAWSLLMNPFPSFFWCLYNICELLMFWIIMLKLPNSFDPLVLQDQLLQTLQQSPLTQQFAIMRVEELIQAVIEKPIVQSLRLEIEKLQNELAEEKKVKRTLRSDSKKYSHQTAKESAEKENQIIQLKETIDEYVEKFD